MARTVYSTRLYASAGLTAAGGVVGPVVPAGLLYVLRDLDVAEVSGTAGTIMIAINQAGGQLWAAQRTAATPLGTFQWSGRQVYGAGERVAFQVFSGTWAIAASGYQLTLP